MATVGAILLFVDGLGMGPADPTANPVRPEVCPNLARLLQEHAVPIDACLGVPGLPQSATGTTALLTGVNAPQRVGRHVEGFPDRALREIIVEHGIFAQMRRRGLLATFANAYFVDDSAEVASSRIQSVTTVAALSAFGEVRGRARMERDDAVYQDLTRHSLRARGYVGPLVEPEASAAHLVEIARRHDLTLFEYFQTDRAGHAASLAAAEAVLALFDRFLGATLEQAVRHALLVALTSDHGNIEDARVRTHTLNPVPFAAVGPGAEALRGRVRSLVDVTPALLEYCGARRGTAATSV